MTAEQIKKILMDRDGMSAEDAAELVDNTRDELREGVEMGFQLCEMEQIIEDNLGLEPDYLDAFLGDLT